MRMMRRTLVALALVISVVPFTRAGDSIPHGKYLPFTVATDNDPSAQISAWLLPAPGRAKGTIFFCHGFRNQKGLLVPYEWIRDQLGWNMILFDFQGHGDSPQAPGQHICTLGYYEQWDLKAVIDWAEENHLEKPYVCFGVSMGAAISLRWAGQDPRISGVLAFSPYKTGWDAMHQFHFHKKEMGILPSLIIHGGMKRMMQDVDIPAAVAQRDNLRIWITVGDHDWFPVDDERAILSASPAPPRLKRLEILPDSGHAQNWKWTGNDPFITDFLSKTEASPKRADVMGWRAGGIVAGAVLLSILVYRGIRNRRVDSVGT